MSGNGKGHDDQFDLDTEVAILEHKNKDINLRLERQDILNERIVETQCMLANKLTTLEANQNNHSKTLEALEKSNTLQTKLLYAIITAGASTIVSLIAMLIKGLLHLPS